MSKEVLLAVAALAVLAAGLAGTPALARSDHAADREREMLLMSPQERLEQRCNARAMGEVSREHKEMRPDEFVAYAFGEPTLKGDTMVAPGAAFRSGGEWYRISYRCQTTSDGLQVIAFDYKLGAKVPRSIWDEHYLVP